MSESHPVVVTPAKAGVQGERLTLERHITKVGLLTRRYLKRCGYTDARVDAWGGRTRLLQDIGLIGDSAWDEFQIMHRHFGVDFSGFSVDDYFPPELSNESLVLTLLWRTKWAERIRQRYPEITLDMIEEVLTRRKWYFDACDGRTVPGFPLSRE